MKIHPLLQDPKAVFVFHTQVPEATGWEHFHSAAFQALEIMQVSLEGDKAVIKPNVTSGEHFANPETGIGTHPAFVRGMAVYLQTHGAQRERITVIEDPRNSDDNTSRHWRGTGYDAIAQEPGIRLHCPSDYTCVKKVVPYPLAHASLNISRLAVAPNTALFNVPKMKTHNLAITTLCLKNLMGLVNVFDRHYCAQAWQELPASVRDNPRPRAEWMQRSQHEDWQTGLARRLVDTAQVIQPALNVVEGVVAREGTGFQRGRNRPLGMVVAGINMAAVDSLTSYLMGFNPQHLIYLQIAARAGLGEIDVTKLCVYVEAGGEMLRCPDVSALRAAPPLRVISSVAGDDQDPFNQLAEPLPGRILDLH